MSKTLQINTPRWAKPLLKPNLRYRAAKGGRGGGKSHFFAELLVERCVMQKTHAVCLREIQKSLTHSVKKLIESKIDLLGVSSYFTITHDRITSQNGSLILFQGMQNHTSDSIKSLEGFDIAWIEEAQSVSQRSLDILRPTIRKPGSEIWVSWNPRNEDDPIQFLVDSPPNDAYVATVNYSDNPWFPDVLRPEIEYDRSRDIDKFNHIWLGGFQTNSEARVFNNWTVDEFEAEPDTTFRFGADFGYAIHPTVLIRSFMVGRRIYVDYEAHMYKCEIVNTPELFGTIPESDLFPIIADSARPETISHLQKHGFPKTFPSVKGKNSIIEGVEWLKSYDIVVHPRCKHTIDELTNYCYEVDKLTGLVTSKLKDDNNHVIDALRYAHEGVRRIQKKVPVHVEPVGEKHFW